MGNSGTAGTELSPSDLAAARIALLAARTMAGLKRPAPSLGYVLTGSEVISADEAVRALAAMAKPVSCTPELHAGVLVLSCRPTPASETPPSEVLGDWEKRGGYYGHLRKRFGDDYRNRTMLCVGDGDILEVTVGDMEIWHRDYHIGPGGSAADEPGSMWAAGWGLTDLAREHGADYITKFFPPDPNAVMAVRTVEQARPAERGGAVPLCEKCGERPAVQRIDRSENASTLTQYLCARCAAAEMALPGPPLFHGLLEALEQASPEQQREMLSEMDSWVTGMERFWQEAGMVPEVEAFFRRWRELRDTGGAPEEGA